MKKRWIITGLVLVPLVAGVIVFSLIANQHKSTEHDNGTTAATPRLLSTGETNTTNPNHAVTQKQHQTTTTTTLKQTVPPRHADTNATTAVSVIPAKQFVTSLLLNQNELIYNDHPLVLSYLRFENKVRDYTVDNSLKIEEDWIGLSQKDNNKSRITINITFAKTDSLNEAIDEVNKARKNVAAIIPEIKNDKNITPFVDRSWGLFSKNGGRLIFIKGTIIVDIHIFDRGGVEPNVFYNVSTKVLDKINKILVGKPVTISILPLSGEELNQDILNSMTDIELGNAIWGKDAQMLIIEKIGIPRIVPAGKIGRNDYLVPLRYVAAILDPQARVEIKGNTATVTLLGKAISLTAGESEVTCDGKAVKIAAPVDIKSGQVLVPLSMLDATVGKPIAWRKEGEQTIGSF